MIRLLYIVWCNRDDLLEANFVLFEWDPAAVEHLLQLMVPAASQVYLCSSLFRTGTTSADSDYDSEENEEDDDDEDEDEDEDEGSSNESKEDNDDDEASVDLNKQREEAIQQIRTQYSGPAKWKQLVELPAVAQAKTEPRFGTKYWQEKRPKDVLSAWQASSSSSTLFSPSPTPFSLPARNPFLTSNFTLVSNFGLSGLDASDVSLVQEKCEPVPDIIVKSSGLTIWHM